MRIGGTFSAKNLLESRKITTFALSNKNNNEQIQSKGSNQDA